MVGHFFKINVLIFAEISSVLIDATKLRHLLCSYLSPILAPPLSAERTLIGVVRIQLVEKWMRVLFSLISLYLRIEDIYYAEWMD